MVKERWWKTIFLYTETNVNWRQPAYLKKKKTLESWISRFPLHPVLSLSNIWFHTVLPVNKHHHHLLIIPLFLFMYLPLIFPFLQSSNQLPIVLRKIQTVEAYLGHRDRNGGRVREKIKLYEIKHVYIKGKCWFCRKEEADAWGVHRKNGTEVCISLKVI